MRFKILAILLFCSLAWAQEISLFQLDQFELKLNPYPWGEELSLAVRGKAYSVLNGGVLTLTISYENRRVMWLNIPLVLEPEKVEIAFECAIETVNKAAQEIFPGEYVVRIEFNLQDQEREFGKKLEHKLKGRTIQVYEKKFLVGTAQRREEKLQEIQNFYLQKIAYINDLFKEFFIQRKAAVLIREDVAARRENPFVTDGKFAKEKWAQWWLGFLQKLEAEKKSLNHYALRSIVLMYPTTHHNLLSYYDVVEQMSRIYTVSLYDFYNIQSQKESKYVDPYGMMGVRETLRHIRQLHQEMAQEMDVNFIKKLGYLPPPPVFSY